MEDQAIPTASSGPRSSGQKLSPALCQPPPCWHVPGFPREQRETLENSGIRYFYFLFLKPEAYKCKHNRSDETAT